jgi:hypothetical protein
MWYDFISVVKVVFYLSKISIWFPLDMKCEKMAFYNFISYKTSCKRLTIEDVSLIVIKGYTRVSDKWLLYSIDVDDLY